MAKMSKISCQRFHQKMFIQFGVVGICKCPKFEEETQCPHDIHPVHGTRITMKLSLTPFICRPGLIWQESHHRCMAKSSAQSAGNPQIGNLIHDKIGTPDSGEMKMVSNPSMKASAAAAMRGFCDQWWSFEWTRILQAQTAGWSTDVSDTFFFSSFQSSSTEQVRNQTVGVCQMLNTKQLLHSQI